MIKKERKEKEGKKGEKMLLGGVKKVSTVVCLLFGGCEEGAFICMMKVICGGHVTPLLVPFPPFGLAFQGHSLPATLTKVRSPGPSSQTFSRCKPSCWYYLQGLSARCS